MTGGRPHTAEVVVYDPLRDLALLSVDGLDVDPLPLGDVTELGAVFGYPAGGELEPAPARVVDRGPYRVRSVHGEWSERDVLVLSVQLAHGYSGGPFVNEHGEVAGVAFALSPENPNVGYAMSVLELNAVLEADRSRAVDTGECVVRK